ncbi:alpha/beta hydrolase [Roseomonas gilardii]|uniref:Alpha/beta hydrolase n=1 Tax=Roseomonas gilardii TaxID=257708 RepID=A0ABU3MIN6_9PROT|nr:alpha/beta hydrolase [Roseomonas gilardii]MDT8332873.1 alpha/beta hydrolase [Roseomonas gilardii]
MIDRLDKQRHGSKTIHLKPVGSRLAVFAPFNPYQFNPISGPMCAQDIATSDAGRPAPQPRNAVEVLGRDFVFPNAIADMPARLSDIEGLRIGFFTTNDGVRLAWWEAGSGPPLVFVPGWSANGAEFVYLLHLLSRERRVIVLDQRNQGLSDKVDHGCRIARLSMDLREFAERLGLRSTDYCGWSMGASVIWSMIDLFGCQGIRKVAFVDEPISIVAHEGWSEREKRDAGSIAAGPDAVVAMMGAPLPHNPPSDAQALPARFMLRASPFFANAEALAEAVVRNDAARMILVMYNHAAGDWRDVLLHKIRVPVAFFTGDWSANVPSQRWAHAAIPGSRLFVYGKEDEGDHFLMLKNPLKFCADLAAFLDQ